MEETRMKWCDELEKLMECPVCFDRLAGTIHMCTAGHNICKSCFEQIQECCICKKPFSSARNYLAEDLSMSLNRMKKSIMDPNDMINKAWNLKKNSIGTQTDFDPLFPNSFASTLDIKVVLPADLPWGDYPCLLNHKCHFKESFVNMINHFKAEHFSDYEEYPVSRMPFSNTWEFPYELQANYNKAFFISKIALFLFHIGIDENGNLRCYIVDYASGRESRRFAYTIEIQSGTEKTFYFSTVNSSRLVTSSLEREGFLISCNEPIYLKFIETKKFEISIDIEKRNISLNEIRNEMSKKIDDNNSMKSMGSVNSLNNDTKKSNHVPRRYDRNNHRRPRNQSLPNHCNSNNNVPKPLMSLASHNPPIILNHAQKQRSHEDQVSRRSSEVSKNTSQSVDQKNNDTAAAANRLRRRCRPSRNQTSSSLSRVDNNSKEASNNQQDAGAGAGASCSSSTGSSKENRNSKQTPRSSNTSENVLPNESLNSIENKLFEKLFNSLKNELAKSCKK